MAMPAMESPFSVVSSYPSTSPKLLAHWESLSSVRFHTTPFVPTVSLKFPLHNLHLLPAKRNGFRLQSSVESANIEEKVEKSDTRRKLFVLNLPWSFSVVDIKNLFGECGSVAHVEIIKQKDGKNRGFAFVTMSSGDEAQAAIEKFDSYEVSSRIIRVQFSKRFKRPSPTPSVRPAREIVHKLYVSNLAWKVRSNSLREFISTSCNPLSVRVVFDNPSGKSAGYGFVSFSTKEEAEAAISVLDGKAMGQGFISHTTRFFSHLWTTGRGSFKEIVQACFKPIKSKLKL
ncbi:28 kDa ribonucleoprotein, chloroplastic-like isoform X1 [Primulina tabacum]|uniref:28 kDa ribonucleoprotein, chloroplastic-like isoform X1 n=1 Tax=Primulina tabacum TaxID=48773 RepID=UPI003F5AC852